MIQLHDSNMPERPTLRTESPVVTGTTTGVDFRTAAAEEHEPATISTERATTRVRNMLCFREKKVQSRYIRWNQGVRGSPMDVDHGGRIAVEAAVRLRWREMESLKLNNKQG
jgi:hypothetical protein